MKISGFVELLILRILIKKNFLKSFHFDEDKSKILKMVKIEMHKNIDLLEKFHK